MFDSSKGNMLLFYSEDGAHIFYVRVVESKFEMIVRSLSDLTEGKILIINK